MSDLPFLWTARQNTVPPEELGLGSSSSSSRPGASQAAPVAAQPSPPPSSTSGTRDPLAAAAAAASATTAARAASKTAAPLNTSTPPAKDASTPSQSSPAPQRDAAPSSSTPASASASASASSLASSPTLLTATTPIAELRAPSSWQGDLVVATRLHFAEATKEDVDVKVLGGFLRCALAIADTVVIAVGASPGTVDKIRALVNAAQTSARQQHQGGKQVHVLPVSPWGKFVPALNALTSFAANHGFKYICFQSLEVDVPPDVIRALVAQLQLGDTLVAGAAFPNDHLFSSGWHVLNGRTSPWNTLAVWAVGKLALTGFSLVAEGLPHEGISAGVEEVSTISILQRIMPRQAKAKLLLHRALLRADTWRTDFQGDEARRDWHRKKMQSKIDRPAAQLDALGIDPGIVQHISLEP
ncbi:Hypothetical Protein FCC1311_066742 [Hondaea fermentalgiana]|uniref:Uncharacterized protein n=1 Tax=Hondaea fermentalgiana TaxID=2315210 RepID=A0A2R5GIM4_9STRA|nr:Hypothetical Protein FCC1311_066742 [Hondaea fermentalgiana]|eukprot:GBG30455.1 Hypothetical Protein FCC1311_066742 [Hondaea fermentalgiana]